MDRIEELIKDYDLDEGMQQLVNEIVEENYHEPEPFMYDANGNFYYKDILVKYLQDNEKGNTLSLEEFEVLLDVLINYIIYKVESKTNAHKRAEEDAYEDEYRSYYGSLERAYWHLLEKYLDDFNYNKPISEFYSEYREEKNITM